MALLDRDGYHQGSTISFGGEKEWNQGAYRGGNYSPMSKVQCPKSNDRRWTLDVGLETKTFA
jgi:hypothetical protein